MIPIIKICNKYKVKPTDIAKKKRGDIKEYTYQEVLQRLLVGKGSLAEDFPEMSKDTTAALLKKIFPGKSKISQPWRAYLLESIEMKRCSKCETIKEHCDFSVNSKEPDGLRAYCRPCSGEVWKAHYDRDSKKHCERVSGYYYANKEQRLEYNKAYYYANPDIYAEHRVKRITREAYATPTWANLQEISKIYQYCPKGYHVDHIIPLQGKIVCGLHTENNLQYLLANENLSKSNSFSTDSYVHSLVYVPPYSES